MHWLKQKKTRKNGYMSLKLDMSKAYDRVNWAFLEAISVKMGMDPKVVSLIMTCVKTVFFSSYQ